VNDEEEYENEEESEDASDFDGGIYVVDDDTARLLEVVIGMIHMLATTQMEETSRENCHIIADELAERFAITLAGDIEVEEIIHGDEVLYKPRGGVMGDDAPEAEGPAPE
jgi:hypothetical protein